MCRFLVYKGSDEILLSKLILDPAHSILTQSFDSRLRLDSQPHNGDGFGIGYYTNPKLGPEPCIFTSTTPAWNCTNLQRIASKTASPLIFAHVRATTEGSLSEDNCHPFNHGSLMWMHNGNLGAWKYIKRRLGERLSDKWYLGVKGGTDSEWAFALFLDTLDRMGYDPSAPPDQGFGTTVLRKAMLKTIKQINDFIGSITKETKKLESIDTRSLLNFAITDGHSVVCTRYVTSKTDEAASLYYSSGTSWENKWEGKKQGDYQMHRRDKGADIVLVASEPLTFERENWVTVPTNSMLTIHKQTVMVHPIIDEYYSPSPYHKRSSAFVAQKGLVTNEKAPPTPGAPLTPIEGLKKSNSALVLPLHGTTLDTNRFLTSHIRSPSGSTSSPENGTIASSVPRSAPSRDGATKVDDDDAASKTIAFISSAETSPRLPMRDTKSPGIESMLARIAFAPEADAEGLQRPYGVSQQPKAYHQQKYQFHHQEQQYLQHQSQYQFQNSHFNHHYAFSPQQQQQQQQYQYQHQYNKQHQPYTNGPTHYYHHHNPPPRKASLDSPVSPRQQQQNSNALFPNNVSASSSSPSALLIPNSTSSTMLTPTSATTTARKISTGEMGLNGYRLHSSTPDNLDDDDDDDDDEGNLLDTQKMLVTDDFGGDDGEGVEVALSPTSQGSGHGHGNMGSPTMSNGTYKSMHSNNNNSINNHLVGNGSNGNTASTPTQQQQHDPYSHYVQFAQYQHDLYQQQERQKIAAAAAAAAAVAAASTATNAAAATTSRGETKGGSSNANGKKSSYDSTMSEEEEEEDDDDDDDEDDEDGDQFPAGGDIHAGVRRYGSSSTVGKGGDATTTTTAAAAMAAAPGLSVGKAGGGVGGGQQQRVGRQSSFGDPTKLAKYFPELNI